MTNKKSTKAVALMTSLVLVTSCFVSGTLARYITTTTSEDSARVAIWGINADDVEMNLFASEYDVNGNKVAKSNDGDKIIAPGTSMSSKFSIVNLDDTLAPEVMYEVKVELDDTEIDQRILDNPSIQWKLDNNEFGTWEETKADILALSGDASGRKVYQALEIANEFTSGKTHTIAWQWMLDDNNVQDTTMGNEAVDEDIVAKIVVKVTARQVQDDVVIATTGSASLNGVAYDTLQSAIDAASVGDTIYLTKSVTESVTIAESQNIILDLNGYNVTGEYISGNQVDVPTVDDYSAIVNNGTLTIKGNGIVDGQTDVSAALFNKGTATLLGGTYRRSTNETTEVGVTYDENSVNNYYTIMNIGTLTVDSNTVLIESNSVKTSAFANGWNSNAAIYKGKAGELIVNAGTIQGGRHAITNNKGNVTIAGGSILSRTTGGKDAIGHDAGVLTINGGTITSTTGIAITAEPNSEIVINAGTITGDIDADGTVTITDNRE